MLTSNATERQESLTRITAYFVAIASCVAMASDIAPISDVTLIYDTNKH